jgi:uncharacterized protein (DUF1800 family)
MPENNEIKIRQLDYHRMLQSVTPELLTRSRTSLDPRQLNDRDVQYPAQKLGQRFFCPKPPSGWSEKFNPLFLEKGLISNNRKNIISGQET